MPSCVELPGRFHSRAGGAIWHLPIATGAATLFAQWQHRGRFHASPVQLGRPLLLTQILRAQVLGFKLSHTDDRANHGLHASTCEREQELMSITVF